MSDDDQCQPSGTPPTTNTDSATLEAVLATPQDHEIRLRLQVAGGIAGERYDFDFTIDGRNGGQCAMHCELSGRNADRQAVSIAPSEVADIMQSIAPAMMQANDDERTGGFPPCSLIGRLEMNIDSARHVHFFMADQGQAETVGYKPPAHVDEAVERLYELAEKRLGFDNVRP